MKVRTLGPRMGCCNICGELGPLTEDHVPPKGTVGISKRDLLRVVEFLNAKEAKARHLQDGVKFRTICSRCNNQVLGSRYDPELRSLCDKVALPLRLKLDRGLTIPRQQKIVTRPQMVARAVIGHLLAAQLRDDMNSPPLKAPFPHAMREYVLDPVAPLPEELDVFCWLYPSEVQVIIHGMGTIFWNSSATFTSYLLKFFPLGFLVTFQLCDEVKSHVPRLIPQRSMALEDESELTLDLESNPRIDWPENPSDDQIHLLNSETAVISLPPRNKRRYRKH